MADAAGGAPGVDPAMMEQLMAGLFLFMIWCSLRFIDAVRTDPFHWVLEDHVPPKGGEFPSPAPKNPFHLARGLHWVNGKAVDEDDQVNGPCKCTECGHNI